VADMDRKESVLDRRLRPYLRRFPFLKRFTISDREYETMHESSIRALGEIGPVASNAIPALVWQSQQGRSVSPAIEAALMKIQGKSITPLVAELDKSDSENWESAALTLGEFREDARATVPSLCRALTAHEPFKRLTAASVMGELHVDAQTAVPALMASIEQFQAATSKRESEVLAVEIDALGKYKHQASGAVPILLRLQQHPDWFVRFTVIRSLFQILPMEDARKLAAGSTNDPNPEISGLSRVKLREINEGSKSTTGGK
jgi:hypothetical protein